VNILAGIIGSGVGIIVIAAVMISLRHMGHAPGFTHPWIHRAMIILMYGAGSLIALTGLGAMWRSFAGYVAGFLGGLGGGIPHAVITIGSFLLILGLIIGLWKAPSAQVATVAAFVPAVLMLTSYGFIHSFWVATSAPAQQVAVSFANWLGG
jgi:hypothetical protein